MCLIWKGFWGIKGYEDFIEDRNSGNQVMVESVL